MTDEVTRTLEAVGGPSTDASTAIAAVQDWIATALPAAWRDAAENGGPGRGSGRAHEPGLSRVVPDVRRLGAGGSALGARSTAASGWSRETSSAAEQLLAPYHLPRLNPLGLNLAAPALFAHGTEEQRLRFLPPIVRNGEIWCQLFSEPGAGSDLASLATRAERTARLAHHRPEGLDDVGRPGRLRRAAGPHRSERPEASGHHLLPHGHASGRRRGQAACGTSAARSSFNEVFIDGAVVPDEQRVGAVGAGWRVAQATLSGERQMVAGAGSGGVDRVGGVSATDLVRLAAGADRAGRPGGWDDAGDPRADRAAVLRGAGPRLDQRAGRARACGQTARLGRRARSARCTRLELNQRIQISWRPRCSGSAALAWDGETRATTPSRCRPRCAACCAAGLTPSRAARPR